MTPITRRLTLAALVLVLFVGGLPIFRFKDVLGPNVTADRLPVTVEFFKRMHVDARTLLKATKEVWNRPRPFVVSTEVKPLGVGAASRAWIVITGD